MFAARVRKEVQVTDPELGDGTVVIRKLNGRSLERASMARQIEYGKLSKAFGAELAMATQELAEKKAAEKKAQGNPAIEAAATDDGTDPRHASYDREYVLTAGIDSWSYPVPCDEKNLADLDEVNSDLLFHAILTLSLPPKKEEAEAAQGKP